MYNAITRPQYPAFELIRFVFFSLFFAIQSYSRHVYLQLSHFHALLHCDNKRIKHTLCCYVREYDIMTSELSQQMPNIFKMLHAIILRAHKRTRLSAIWWRKEQKRKQLEKAMIEIAKIKSIETKHTRKKIHTRKTHQRYFVYEYLCCLDIRLFQFSELFNIITCFQIKLISNWVTNKHHNE